MAIVCLAFRLYAYALLGWVILSWIRVPYDHPLSKVNRFLDKIIMPVVLPLRRVIPPLNLGGVALDLSVLVIFFGLQILSNIICR
jgi:YggT family protein